MRGYNNLDRESMNPISKTCSGIILAGGMSKRFNGTDKALIKVNGRLILDHIHDVYSEIFSEIILVTNNPLPYLGWNMLTVTDLFSVRSSLTGIHAGLFYSSLPFSFVCACDAPFLKKDLVRLLIAQASPKFDAVMPETSKGLEPLCAVYSKTCIKNIEDHIRQDKFKIQKVFNPSRIRKIEEEKLRKTDPDLSSFININTPDDLNRILSS